MSRSGGRGPPNTLPDHKSHKSAVVLVPKGWGYSASTSDGSHPEISKLLDWIQDVRSSHDRHIRRWPMPHITLLYPFAHPRDNALVYEQVIRDLREACRTYPASGEERISISSGKDGFGYFLHSKKSSTVYLKPQQKSWLVDLMQHILSFSALLSDYDEQIREGGRLPKDSVGDDEDVLRQIIERHFSPHLSLGQWQGRAAAESAIHGLMATFPGPIQWDVRELCILQRDGFKDPFRVVDTISIGAADSDAGSD
ncbi:hypothetical protein OE88DRAFT_1738667 [Heliocybe sulcata]|uniref:2',3'-cyclic-nucleotide 3'-phosphodiesterase n=1 Tax=Heliocybe sulcata TaxID=5364 RepID=A0A5C3N0V7_9AGAM|nr:hypothetical protein OE88DRAFT_1738667 [Heliocybe sulcata]